MIVSFGLTQVNAQQLENSLLWQISGNNLQKPSYVYGTIHMICPDDLVMKDYFKKSLLKTEQLVLELDMDEPTLMTDMQKFSVNEGMKNISTEMTDEEQKIVNDFFQKKYNAGLQQLGIIKPFALNSMVLPKYIDCPQPQSYEAIFMQLAKQDSMDVLGLETVEFQFGVFDNISMEDQIDMLLETITDSAKVKDQLNRLIGAYQQQDLGLMYEIGNESPQYKDFEDVLINDRNANWIKPMEAFMQQQPTFFAVGALHLGGDKGVIKLLQQAGYTVEPVLE